MHSAFVQIDEVLDMFWVLIFNMNFVGSIVELLYVWSRDLVLVKSGIWRKRWVVEIFFAIRFWLIMTDDFLWWCDYVRVEVSESGADE